MTYTPRNSFLLAVLFTVIASVLAQQRIDCRRFVFAPICRGVAAKRSDGGIATSRLLHSMMPQRRMSEAVAIPEVPDPYVTPPSEDMDMSAEMSADHNDNHAVFNHRTQRNRKVLLDPSRHHGQQEDQGYYPLYIPRLSPGVPMQSEYEY